TVISSSGRGANGVLGTAGADGASTGVFDKVSKRAAKLSGELKSGDFGLGNVSGIVGRVISRAATSLLVKVGCAKSWLDGALAGLAGSGIMPAAVDLGIVTTRWQSGQRRRRPANSSLADIFLPQEHSNAIDMAVLRRRARLAH